MTSASGSDTPESAPPSRVARLLVALGVAVAFAVFVFGFGYGTHQLAAGGSDFDQLWFAARALVSGREPYDLIGPGREFEWPWPLLYPMTAVVAATPFTFVPVVVARVLFASLSAGILAFALSREHYGRLPILISAAMMDAASAVQLAPLLTASMLLPSCFWIGALKPNVGVAFAAATESRRSLAVAAGGAILLVGLSFALNPDWLARWMAALSSAHHLRIPLLATGGPLLLLALFRWRRLDARILLACACVPHTPVVYDLVPLGLLARNVRESFAFVFLTYGALFAQEYFVHAGQLDSPTVAARILNLAVYLPCLMAVLLRPNEGAPPAWMTLLGGRQSPVVSSDPVGSTTDPR